MNSHKPVEEANAYVWFVYVAQTIFNHIQGNVSVSMSAGPLNTKFTGHQSTKKFLVDELGGCFISSKIIDWCQQEFTFNLQPCHDLPQAYGENKSVYPLCIRLTQNLLMNFNQINVKNRSTISNSMIKHKLKRKYY